MSTPYPTPARDSLASIVRYAGRGAFLGPLLCLVPASILSAFMPQPAWAASGSSSRSLLTSTDVTDAVTLLAVFACGCWLFDLSTRSHFRARPGPVVAHALGAFLGSALWGVPAALFRMWDQMSLYLALAALVACVAYRSAQRGTALARNPPTWATPALPDTTTSPRPPKARPAPSAGGR